MDIFDWFIHNGIRIILLIIIIIIIIILIEVIIYNIIQFYKKWNYSYNNKHILICGGLTGIGKEIGKQLIQKCKILTILEKDKTLLRSTKYEIEDCTKCQGDNVKIVSCDPCDFFTLTPEIEGLINVNGDVDMVVYCAEWIYSTNLFDVQSQEFEDVLELYYGFVNLMKIFLPKMMNVKKGEIVVILPWVTLSPYTGYATSSPYYNAISGYIHVMRNELSKFPDIKV